MTAGPVPHGGFPETERLPQKNLDQQAFPWKHRAQIRREICPGTPAHRTEFCVYRNSAISAPVYGGMRIRSSATGRTGTRPAAYPRTGEIKTRFPVFIVTCVCNHRARFLSSGIFSSINHKNHIPGFQEYTIYYIPDFKEYQRYFILNSKNFVKTTFIL